MSVLTRSKILERIKKGDLVIDPFDKKLLGPASYDLHLGNKFRVFKRNQGQMKLTESVDFESVSDLIQNDGEIVLRAGEMIHGVTKEKIKFPPDLCGWLEGRSRFGRLGLSVHITAAFFQPGINCNAVLEIHNSGPLELIISPGLVICQMVFEECLGKTRYTGRFQNQKEP